MALPTVCQRGMDFMRSAPLSAIALPGDRVMRRRARGGRMPEHIRAQFIHRHTGDLVDRAAMLGGRLGRFTVVQPLPDMLLAYSTVHPARGIPFTDFSGERHLPTRRVNRSFYRSHAHTIRP